MKYPSYPKYKDSGVEWLGEVPEHWEVKRLKYSASINDEVLPESTAPDYSFKYIDISSVDPLKGVIPSEELAFEDAPSRARRIVREGDTILSTVRTYLKSIAAITHELKGCIASTGFAVIRPQAVAPSYLSFALRESGFIDTVVARSVGVSYPAVNASDVGSIPITLPPLPEQYDIASFLDAQTSKIDTLIAKKRELIGKLKEKRAALITRTVTRGLPPEAARAAGLDPNPRMKDSGVEWLGEVPEHWGVKRLKHLLSEPLQYGANEAAELDDSDLPRYVRITDVREDGSLREETFRSLPLDIAKHYLLREGDVLFARSGATVGKTFLYSISWGACAYAGYMIRARLDTDSVVPSFVRYFTASNCYWEWVSSVIIQATIQNISAEKYNEIRLPVPSIDEQASIAGYLDRETAKLDALTAKVESAIERLQEYRSALITAAVTGKIDVREAMQ